MPRFISATYHPRIRTAEFICDDGRHLLRCGGTLPWRLNNGGDLVSPVDSNNRPAPKKTKNYIGFATIVDETNGQVMPFFIFPSYEAGREQMAISIRRRYSGCTIPQLVQKYAPSTSKKNNTTKYTEGLLKGTGIDQEKKIGELSDDDYGKLLDSIERIEGYHAKAETRKEVWVPVSRITATDGARPLAEEEVVLRINGKDTTLKTNDYGQLPPIPHPNGQKVEVLHKQAGGELKSVGTISGDNGQHFSLTAWFKRFFAMPGPNKASDMADPRRRVMAYTVLPDDTLATIAARFQTTEDQIRKDNRLRSTSKVFPGQKLGIYGPLPAEEAKARAKPNRSSAPQSDPKAKGKAAPPANENALAFRTNTGKPIAIVRTEQRMAPWMAIAFREAATYAGKDESEITKTHNYHRLVTDSDRAGGRTVEIKDKKGKVTGSRKVFDGLRSLAGDGNPWCASFVNYCLKEAGYAPGRRHMSSYTFGEDADLFFETKVPVYGAIRFSRREGGGHVCFVYGTVGEKLVILGGNQRDELSFQLRKAIEPGARYFVPLPYKDFATSVAGNTLPIIDIDALKNEFISAVSITDEQIKATNLNRQKES